MIESPIGHIINLDQHLGGVVHQYGMWTYLILFCIVFFETGCILTSFLPGDSLLFVSGAVAASGILNLNLLLATFIFGAICGNIVNYWLGNYIGVHIFLERFPSCIKKEHFDDANKFFDKYGGATVFIARFVPVVRAFAPFLAGVGSMEYHRFLFYNVVGAVSWTFVIVLAGYYLGGIPLVRQNMSLLLVLVLIITAVTILIIIAGILKSYKVEKDQKKVHK